MVNHNYLYVQFSSKYERNTKQMCQTTKQTDTCLVCGERKTFCRNHNTNFTQTLQIDLNTIFKEIREIKFTSDGDVK